ncbi:MAG: hypothetical protein COA85_02250 [Robiginitomaculum sp.]|nr:MAG: hypothetical protein COA85_02250 [Robiginitomaculum sp.]
MGKSLITFFVLGASLAFSSAHATDDKLINDKHPTDHKDTAIAKLINDLDAFKVTTNETLRENMAATKRSDSVTYDPILTIYVDTMTGGRFDRYGYEHGFKGYYPYEQAPKFSVGYSSGYGDGSASHDYGAYGYNDALYQRVKQYRKEKRNR